MYYDSEPDEYDLNVAINRLASVFKFGKEFAVELTRSIARTGMTKQQLKDAVDYAIDNHKYQQLVVSDIVSYEPKLKMYSYREVYKICGSFGLEKDKDEFPRMKLKDGRIVRVKYSDVINLPSALRERVERNINLLKQEESGNGEGTC